jgi:hypothetical protein
VFAKMKMQEVFKMKRSCNCNNTGKGRRCGLCSDREKRLANVPRGINPVDCLSGGSKKRYIRAVVERVWDRCDGCSVLSFAPDPRTLVLVTVDGTPVSFDSWEHADKIVLVTKGEARKLDTMDQEERMKQFDKRLLVLVQNGWK